MMILCQKKLLLTKPLRNFSLQLKTWQKQYILFYENDIFTVQLIHYSKVTLL